MKTKNERKQINKNQVKQKIRICLKHICERCLKWFNTRVCLIKSPKKKFESINVKKLKRVV